MNPQQEKNKNPLYQEALERFYKLFGQAQKTRMEEPSAMSLAAANPQGRPSVRTVLLKQADETGFVFFTNKESRKGAELVANPWAALCFYWPPLKHQVLVEGRIEMVSEKEADIYWNTRPRMSQIGAWASRQSRPMAGMKQLLKRVAFFQIKFAGRKVPRPPHWTGFRVVPDRIEFWRKRPFRLHERVEYKKTNNVWKRQRLFP